MINSQQCRTVFLNDLFSEYQKQGIAYCLLRNHESLPDLIESSDIDIMISSSRKAENYKIVSALAKKHDVVIYNHRVDERFEQIYLYRRIGQGDMFELKLDFFHSSEVYGVCLIAAEEILQARVRYRNFYIASDTFRALDKWLYVYLLGSPLPLKYHDDFQDIFIRHPESLNPILSRLFGKKAGSELYTTVCSRGFSGLPKMGKGELFAVLLKTAVNAPVFHSWHLPLFFFYRFRDFIFPLGEFISVSGPDGSGKTTVLEIAGGQLKRLFRSRSGSGGHFRPSVLPRIAYVAKRVGILAEVDEDYDMPHRAEPSGVLGSLFRFCYYLVDYVLGYFLKIRPALVRRELVTYDRYCFDMVADPGRSRVSLPLWIRRVTLWIAPLPSTAFFIFVPPEVVRGRKQEISAERIEDLNAQYLGMAEASRLQILENSSTAEAVAANLVDAVIERRRKRLKLDRFCL